MALQDLQSQYGPQNTKGSIGTGTTADTFAYENGTGLSGKQSIHGPSSTPGTKPTGPDAFGNIPPERSGE